MNLKDICKGCLRSDLTLCPLLDFIVPKLDSPPACIVDMWNIFTKYLNTTEDSFPDKICSDCLAEIYRTYTFMLKCERSANFIKKMHKDEVTTKKLQIIHTAGEPERSKNSKSENGIDHYIPQIETEEIEWNLCDEADADREQFEVIINENVASYEDSRLQHEIIAQGEHDNFEIELLHLPDYESDIGKDELPSMQHLEEELKLNTAENDEFHGNEAALQSSTELVVCRGCNFMCGTESLQQHIIDSHMEKQICKLCNQGFECSAIEHCSLHLKSNGKIPPKERLLRCKQKLKENLRFPIGGPPNKRENESNTFQQKFSLYLNSRPKTEELPYKCESCAKSFRSKHNLKLHLKCHTKEKPFKCKICSSTFKQRSSLNQHLKLHTAGGSDIYKCESCPKTFMHKGHLLDHARSHSEKLSLKCKICLKSFKHETSFMEHFKHHAEEILEYDHLEEFFEDDQTEESFKYVNPPKPYLRKDILTHHNSQLDRST